MIFVAPRQNFARGGFSVPRMMKRPILSLREIRQARNSTYEVL
jgi:hypothetical protein